MDKPAKNKDTAKPAKPVKAAQAADLAVAAPPKAAKKPKDAKDFRIFNEEIAAIVSGVHANPFAVLGIHEFGKQFVARTFIPGAEEVVAHTLAGETVGTLP